MNDLFTGYLGILKIRKSNSNPGATSSPDSIFQAIPTDTKTGKLTPVKKWQDVDEAWSAVMDGIKKLL